MSDASTVLVPVDFSPHARAAVVRACDLARACDAQVRLIHGIDHKLETGGESGTSDDLAETDARTAMAPSGSSPDLESWCADLALRGALISAIVEREDPAALIARHALANDVVLIVMGMHGFHDVGRLFFGSVADRALRAARVPIMLVKENERDASARIRRILLATDFSPAAEQALQLAIHWARRLEADVEVLHAIPDPDEERLYEQPRDCASRSARNRANALEGLRSILTRTAAAGVRAVADLTYGAPSIEIVKYAARSRADLVVMGLRERTQVGIARYGSVTERVIRHVKCSVLVAPEERAGTLRPTPV
ncbi:MAG: universal stress protein [Deltaproteobacteria bacterium]|nr:universal stress protein [Deltaproteobacteria bacterium]